MNAVVDVDLVPYDQMKDRIEKESLSLIEKRKAIYDTEPPAVSLDRKSVV